MIVVQTEREQAFLGPEDNQVEARRHANPDGSQGGWVPADMVIPEDVTVHHTSLVLPGAKLEAGETVGPHSIREAG